MRNILWLGLLLSLFAYPAFACAMMEKGNPRVGGIATRGIQSVSLTFSGKIFPEKSTLEVTDDQGTSVSLSRPYGNDTTLAVKTKPLTSGRYTVTWNTLCDCGSYMPGHYRFTVQ